MLPQEAEAKALSVSYEDGTTASLSKSKASASKRETSHENLDTLMIPSTDTTLSSKSTRVEDQPESTEILLMELDTLTDLAHEIRCDDSDSVSSSGSSSSSVMSRYFERTDFSSWEDLYSNAPHVGFAMVAGGFACLHPIMFFAGLATAMGAYSAAGATYNYAASQLKSMVQQDGEEDSMPSNMMISCDCLPSVFGYYSTDEAKRLTPAHDHKVLSDPAPSLAKTASTCSTNASSVDNVSLHGTKLHKPLSNDSNHPTVPSVIQSPTTIEPMATDKGFDAAQWVRDNFPSLPHMALDNVEFKGLKAHEFFDVFFADDAPFGFPAFHKLRRDKEVQYGPWKEGVVAEHYADLPSLATMKERHVGYHAKTNSFLGPAYAPTTKIQRAYFVSKRMLVIDIRMTLQDIPFSKHFYLIERWVVDGTRNCSSPKKHSKKKVSPTPSSNDPSPSHSIFLTVSSQVFFTEDCAFESAVTKESAKQVCEISKCWNAMAQDGLKRTEEARSKRLRQKERLASPVSQKLATADNVRTGSFENDESIEIEHLEDRSTGRRRKSLLNRRSSFSQFSSQEVNQHPLRSRSLSQTFSKLLVRGGNAEERLMQSSPPKVRISSGLSN